MNKTESAFLIATTLLATSGCLGSAVLPLPYDGGPEIDAASPLDAGGDAGADATVRDAGSDAPGPVDSSIPLDSGMRVDSGFDAGFDAGSDAGFDGGSDGGVDAGFDAGFDGGADSGFDSGFDAGFDAGLDSGVDAASDAALDSGLDASDSGCGPGCALVTVSGGGNQKITLANGVPLYIGDSHAVWTYGNANPVTYQNLPPALIGTVGNDSVNNGTTVAFVLSGPTICYLLRQVNWSPVDMTGWTPFATAAYYFDGYNNGGYGTAAIYSQTLGPGTYNLSTFSGMYSCTGQ